MRVSIGSSRHSVRHVRRVSITHRWSGQVIETNDGLPYIGEMSPHQFAATGFAGNGLTFGTLAGMMAVDAIAGRENPWAGTFDIGRTKIRGGLWDYIKENKDYPYYLVRDRFAGVESRPLRSIARGEGTVVEVRGKPAAAYRRDDGKLCCCRPSVRTWGASCDGTPPTARGTVRVTARASRPRARCCPVRPRRHSRSFHDRSTSVPPSRGRARSSRSRPSALRSVRGSRRRSSRR